MHERYRQTDDRQTDDRQTDDRQTDDRQTDGRAIAYSEREREFTFAKNGPHEVESRGTVLATPTRATVAATQMTHATC